MSFQAVLENELDSELGVGGRGYGGLGGFYKRTDAPSPGTTCLTM